MSKRNKKKNIGKKEVKTFRNILKENKKILIGVGAGAAVLIAVIVIITAVLNSHPLYGTYEIGDVLYLSPLNSAAQETYGESFTGLTVSRKEFSIATQSAEETFEKPDIRTEPATEELLGTFREAMSEDAPETLLDGVEQVHYIYTAEGKRTNYMLLEKADQLLFVEYHIVNKMNIWHIIVLED